MSKKATLLMKKTSLDMDERIESLLCYVLVWITGIIFFLIEQDNKKVRFHALQSVALFLPLTLFYILLKLIPYIGGILANIVLIIGLILWIVLMYKAYKGEELKLPIVGEFAEKHL